MSFEALGTSLSRVSWLVPGRAATAREPGARGQMDMLGM